MRRLPLLLVLFDLSCAYFANASSRYGIHRRRWDRPMLTWRLETKNINAADQYTMRNTLHRAFAEWEGVPGASIKFAEKDDGSPTDLIVGFERRKHGDQFPFDGKDGIVAHAFFPRDGRLHFDADELWTLNSPYGVNLFQTAVHEIGHLLGLPHSKDPRAVMNVAKKPYDPEFKLGEDDIKAIQRLYPHMEKVSNSAYRDPMLNTFPFDLPSNLRRYYRKFQFLRV